MAFKPVKTGLGSVHKYLGGEGWKKWRGIRKNNVPHKGGSHKKLVLCAHIKGFKFCPRFAQQTKAFFMCYMHSQRATRSVKSNIESVTWIYKGDQEEKKL